MSARILLLEDDHDSLLVLTEALELKNYQVTPANSIAAARDAIYREPFEAVVSDLLVDSSSVEIASTHLRELAALVEPTPIGLLTGVGLRQLKPIDDLLEFVLAKPFKLSVLHDELARITQSRSLTADERALVTAYFTHLGSRNWQAFVDLCAPDVIYQVPGVDARFATIVRGRAQLLPFLEQTFRTFDDCRYEVTNAVALPRYLSCAYAGSWVEGGSRFTNPGHVMLRIEHGRIAFIGVRFNPSTIAERGARAR